MNIAAQYTEEFKNDAARYWKKHPELGIAKRAKNLGVSKTALSNWRRIYDSNEGTVPTRGRGNFESNNAKELARLRKELRDTRDALDVLKNPSAYWEMTEALFLETARYEEQVLEEGKRRPNVSGALRILGVSRSGYLAWKNRLPSNREKRKEHEDLSRIPSELWSAQNSGMSAQGRRKNSGQNSGEL